MERVGEWTGSRVSGRDLEVLEFVARFGVVPRSAVARWAGTGKTATAVREKRLREAGLVAVSRPWLSPEPALVATGEGLALCGRGELAVARASPSTLRHFSVAAHLAAELECAGEELLSERELLAHERGMGERVFSIRLSGEEKYHRPDIVILPPADEAADTAPASDWGRQGPSSGGTQLKSANSASGLGRQGPSRPRTQGSEERGAHSVRDPIRATEDAGMRRAPDAPIAVEVELTAKGKVRLDEILAGWKTAVASARFARVHYYCSSGALPYVKRSVERADAGAEVTVEALPDGDHFASPIYS